MVSNGQGTKTRQSSNIHTLGQQPNPPLHYGPEQPDSTVLIIHSPSRSGVSERANGQASGPVLTSRFLADLNLCATLSKGVGSSSKGGVELFKKGWGNLQKRMGASRKVVGPLQNGVGISSKKGWNPCK